MIDENLIKQNLVGKTHSIRVYKSIFALKLRVGMSRHLKFKLFTLERYVNYSCLPNIVCDDEFTIFI